MECHWKWDKTQNDTFQVVTGSNITNVGLLPGPTADSAGDVKGKFFFSLIFISIIIKNKSEKNSVCDFISEYD